MIFSVFQKKNGFLGILGPPYCGIGATIRIGREMLCLLYSGFSPKEMWVLISKGLKHLNTVLHSCCPAVQYCEPRCQVASTRQYYSTVLARPLSKPTGSGRAAGSWGSSLRTDGADRLEYRQGLESVQQCDGVLYISVCELPPLKQDKNEDKANCKTLGFGTLLCEPHSKVTNPIVYPLSGFILFLEKWSD